jgi:hypothetical protein
MKLKVEALRSVNAFLDELLWNILSLSRSLSTDRIKTSLLKILPTTLGKEALLEAEVELKAYWERTIPTPNPTAIIEGEQFPLQWSFELLRLKCEAYSTLNDSDEDVNSENRLSERMRDLGHVLTPPAALVAPAALYLTAIIEYICEHLLSNISRVVARDSSRTSATPHDLFVALCEDSTVYDTFRSMKVYSHIENLQKSSRPRRSKSFSHDKLVTTSRTSSQHSDLSSTLRESNSAQSRIRMSSESIGFGATTVQSPSRGSLERAKVKLFGHSRTPSENGVESQSLHRKSDLGYADSTNGSLVDVEQDQVLKDEFDELMRSGTTMKVSLTPDRLKSMEVYNKEKNRRGTTRHSANKRDVVNGHHDETLLVIPFDSKRLPRPSNLKHVDSIVEDEEDFLTASSVAVMSLPATPQSHKFPIPPPVDANGRLRSMSTSQASGPPKLLHKSSWSSISKTRTPISKKRDLPGSKHLEASGNLTRARKPQRNIENMDLDEVMNGSDDEDEESAPPSSYKLPIKAVVLAGPKMSATTRELIDFLAEGPPQELQEPQRLVSAVPSSPKAKPGRLGRMMSRLTGGPSTERLREESSVQRTAYFSSPAITKGAGNTQQSLLSAAKSLPGVIVGTPPRPPRAVQPITPISPPLSPSYDKLEAEELQPPQATHNKVTAVRKPVPTFEPVKAADPMRLAPPPSRHSSRASSIQSISTGSVLPNGRVNGSGTKRGPSQSSRTDGDATTKVEDEIVKPAPSLTKDRAQELRRLLANATNADECRVLVDMFLARIGFPVDRNGADSPYPSPIYDPRDKEVENSLVEVLLGGASGSRSASSHSMRSEVSEPQNSNDNLLSVVSPQSESLKSVQDTQFRHPFPRTLAVV